MTGDELVLLAILAGTTPMLAFIVATRSRGAAYRASPRSAALARRSLDYYGGHEAMLAASWLRPDGVHELHLPSVRRLVDDGRPGRGRGGSTRADGLEQHHHSATGVALAAAATYRSARESRPARAEAGPA